MPRTEPTAFLENIEIYESEKPAAAKRARKVCTERAELALQAKQMNRPRHPKLDFTL